MSTYLDTLLGQAGKASFTTTSASFTQPAVGGSVTVPVLDASWVPVGLGAFMATGGNYQVTAVPDSTHVTIKNLGGSSNAAPAATVPTAQRFAASGVPGATGATGQPGKGVFPVRAVQTAALTSWVYDKAAGTLTAPANGALPSPWTAFDSVTSPATTDAGYLVNTLGIADAQNGVYTLATVGSAGTKAVLQRRADLNENSEFLGGAAFDVLDGSTRKGTRWQLYTQTTVDLFAVTPTPLLFDVVITPSTIDVDLSKPPYSIRDYPTIGAAIAAGNVDYGPKICQALYDYRNSPGAVLRMPAANGGVVLAYSPIRHYANAYLDLGGGTLVSGISGGPLISEQYMGQTIGADEYPQVGASPVDTGTFGYIGSGIGCFANPAGPITVTPTPLSLWRNAQDAAPPTNIDPTDRQFYFHLGDAGLHIDGWPHFQCDVSLSWDRIGDVGTAPVSHVVSCRGRRTVNDVPDIQNPCFFIELDETTRKLTGRLRLTDTTKGVYGATVHTGTGTSTCIGDATIKPTSDTSIVVSVSTGGTVGVAGCKISYSLNGFSFHEDIALGTATTYTITNDVNEFSEPFSAKVVFQAGQTLVAGDTYTIPCTGVTQNIQLTSDTVVSADLTKNWLCTLMYDGTKVRFGVSLMGGARDASASMATGTAATGVVKQRFWEHTVLGRGQNYSSGESGIDFAATRAFMGSIRFMNVIAYNDGAHDSGSVTPILPPATTPTNLVSGAHGYSGSGQKLFWRPSAETVMRSPDGIRYAYMFETEIGRAFGFMIPYSATTGVQVKDGGVGNGTLACGTDPSQRGTGLLTRAWTSLKLKQLRFTGGKHGWLSIGPDFKSVYEDLYFSVGWSYSLRYAGGVFNINSISFVDSAADCFAIFTGAAVTCPGSWFMNLEQGYTKCCCVFDDMLTSVIGQVGLDAENQISTQTGRDMFRICMRAAAPFEIGGEATLAETLRFVTSTGGNGAPSGPVVLDKVKLAQTSTGRQYPPLSALFTDTPAFVMGPSSAIVVNDIPLTAHSICDRAGKVQRRGISLVTNLTTGSQSVTWLQGVVLKLRNNTLAANSTYTIARGLAQVGDIQEILVESQATYTTTIANGGPAGASGIYVNPATPAATKDRYRLRLDETGNWVSA